MDWLDKVNELKKKYPEALVRFSICQDEFNFNEYDCVLVSQAHVRHERMTIYGEDYLDLEDLEEAIVENHDSFSKMSECDFNALTNDKIDKMLSEIVKDYDFEYVITISVGC